MRLLDPDTVLKNKIVEFVGGGEFGLSSGQRPDGSYEHVWYEELIGPEEVAFEPGVFLLTKEKGQAYKESQKPKPQKPAPSVKEPGAESQTPVVERIGPVEHAEEAVVHIRGTVPPSFGTALGQRSCRSSAQAKT